MKTTVILPDELFSRAKTEAALRGIEFEDLLAQGLRNLLDRPAPISSEPVSPESKVPVSLHEAMRDCCGIAKNTPTDYASNPAYFEGFGQ